MNKYQYVFALTSVFVSSFVFVFVFSFVFVAVVVVIEVEPNSESRRSRQKYLSENAAQVSALFCLVLSREWGNGLLGLLLGII